MTDIKQADAMMRMAQRDMAALNGMQDAKVFADEIFEFHVQHQARHVLDALETHASSAQAQVDLFAAPPAIETVAASAVDTRLSTINPDILSPREALEALYQLKALAEKIGALADALSLNCTHTARRMVMGLQWRDQLSVGNDLIDTDHKHLIEVINKAELSLKANNKLELKTILDELSRYSSTHFEREELIAKAVGYPDSAQLHESHTWLVANLNQFKADIGDTWTEAAVTQFTAFLRDWLIEHVIKEDLPMKPWMIKHSPRFDPRC